MPSERTHDSRRLAIEEIQEIYPRCLDLDDMRSAPAILRISAEQLDCRSDRRAYDVLLLGTGAFLFVTITAFKFMGYRPFAYDAVGFTLALFVPAMHARIRYHGILRAYKEEDRQIMELFADALNKIVLAPAFVPEPLDKVEKRLVRKLYRTAPAAQAAFEKLLNASPRRPAAQGT